ncbi:hypothetical protein MRX96_018567 [Rhipicephalus microplus]
MPIRRRNYCLAPGCRTGYLDKKLDEFSAVCELHFEPRFVIEEFVHHIDGKGVRIPRDKPMLSENAVPTILPNLPQYLMKKMPKPRAKRKMCENDHAAAKKKSRSALETDVLH